ncbi:MAG: sigma-70 family RNA polymerase sigma factor [Bacteroidota bacterium]|nr:sigma-70 family RNA polymerase sigma factor [Bacteroidota bacterium]
MQTVSKYHKSDKQIRSEIDLIKAAQRNPAYFEVLYNKYYEQLLKFIYQRVNSKDTAFDITSQVFLKALVNLPRYQPKGVPFSAWLYRIAINEMNRMFKTNVAQRALNVEMNMVGDIMEEMKEDNQEEKHNQLIDALTRLEEPDLQMIEMRFFEKRAFKEIAHILNITENNAKVKVYRILEKLKNIITKNGNN